MKKILTFLGENTRSIFYAISTGLGLAFSIQLLKDYGTDRFLLAVVITSLVFLFQIYLNWRFAAKLFRQIDMPIFNVYNLFGNILNHITLPIILFFTEAFFLYFNADDLIRVITILCIIVVDVILFINVRSYYKDEFRVEEKTRYVFDLIKLIIFFFGVNIVLHVQSLWDMEIGFAGIIVCFLALALSLLLIYRKGQITILTTLFIIVASFIVSCTFMVTSLIGIFALGVNVLTFLLFYFVLSILHHRLERTLTFEIFAQYVLILVLAFLLLLGLS